MPHSAPPRDYEKELGELLDIAKVQNALVPMIPDTLVGAEQVPTVRWVSSNGDELPYAHA